MSRVTGFDLDSVYSAGVAVTGQAVGAWHAVMHRVAPSRPLWQATLARTTVPHDQYTSQAYPEAVDTRTWCLRTIAELAGAVP